MIIGEKKMQHLMKMPYIETWVSKSKDGKWIVNKTTITSIKPTKYFEAVLNNEGEEEVNVSEEVSKEVSDAKQKLEV